MSGGEQIHFERASFLGDSLIGEIEYQTEDRGEVKIVRVSNVSRRYPIALSRIDSVVVERRDLGKTVLLGAGAAAVTIFLVDVMSADEPEKSGNGGREGPVPPSALR